MTIAQKIGGSIEDISFSASGHQVIITLKDQSVVVITDRGDKTVVRAFNETQWKMVVRDISLEESKHETKQ